MDKKQIVHLADLAKIYLSEEEKDKMLDEVRMILDFVSKLQDIDVDNVEPMYTPINIKMDYTNKVNTQVDPEEIISNTPNNIENNLIVIKSSTVKH